jgi:hypothetical protein
MMADSKVKITRERRVELEVHTIYIHLHNEI